MYMMSFFSIPKGVLKKLDYFRSRFFWQGDENKKKYRLAKWTILCKPKDQGGLGILDLNTKNVALAQNLWLKWNGKLETHFWSCLMKVKLDFLRFGTFIVKDGSQENNWLDGTSLRNQYPSLYNIARSKFITIAEAMSSSPPSLSWRRHLFGTNLDDWNTLLARIEGFSIKSHYAALMLRNIPNVNRKLWKLEALLKVKMFLWYLQKGVILTKNNLVKCRWQGSLTCAFCHKEETINHLFFECRLARSVWSVLQIATGINQPQNKPSRNQLQNNIVRLPSSKDLRIEVHGMDSHVPNIALGKYTFVGLLHSNMYMRAKKSFHTPGSQYGGGERVGKV
ncbi:hypothetical protein U9M48_034759 [Paspalum notatum var. saurae]|uniref:Reverse transcriptase zinc-binding domain-containing protein n=1 Tax=Paspalum notatum var. saurae TaxID=547442 RepID=A0AAQ3UAD2_PASNO